MVQTLPPTSTLTPADWDSFGDTPDHATVDEGVDTHDEFTTYLRGQVGGGLQTVVGLATGSDPGVHSGHVIRVVFRKVASVGNPATRVYVQLFQGATPITGIEESGLARTTLWKTFEYTLTTAEAAAITDYSDLRLSLTTTSVPATNLDLRVTAVELQLPDVVESVVAWTLAEGASDAVAAALTAGMSAKLDALDTEYGDIVLPDIAAVHRNPMSVDDGIQTFPVLAVYSPGGQLPILNDGGHADGLFEIEVQVLVKDRDQAVLQKYVYRYVRAAVEVLTEAWVASTLDEWNLQASLMSVVYSPFVESTEWSSGAVLTIQMNKLEAK